MSADPIDVQRTRPQCTWWIVLSNGTHWRLTETLPRPCCHVGPPAIDERTIEVTYCDGTRCSVPSFVIPICTECGAPLVAYVADRIYPPPAAAVAPGDRA